MLRDCRVVGVIGCKGCRTFPVPASRCKSRLGGTWRAVLAPKDLERASGYLRGDIAGRWRNSDKTTAM